MSNEKVSYKEHESINIYISESLETKAKHISGQIRYGISEWCTQLFTALTAFTLPNSIID